MQRTTGFERGDVVLVEFLFTDESERKLRPALVISANPYQQSRQEVIIAAITSNVRRRLFGEHRIVGWRAAGLVFPSTVTGIIRTVRQSMIGRRLGALSESDLDATARQLRQSLAL